MRGTTSERDSRPVTEARRISSMLDLVLGQERYPLKVEELALEYSRQCFAGSPVDRIHGEDLEGLEGMLVAHKTRSRWMIVYNSAVSSEGRKRFTIAHEFGHYLLHRGARDRFECSNADIETAQSEGRQMEAEADRFASALLMPLQDFARQVHAQSVDFDLLEHCAQRYGVSLTAAALRWTQVADQRVIVVASRDDHLLWAKSNDAAYKSGAYFATRKNTIEVPGSALAHSRNVSSDLTRSKTSSARDWFTGEPASMPLTEITRWSPQQDFALTLLLMPESPSESSALDEGEAEEDTLDRFERNGQPLQR